MAAVYSVEWMATVSVKAISKDGLVTAVEKVRLHAPKICQPPRLNWNRICAGRMGNTI